MVISQSSKLAVASTHECTVKITCATQHVQIPALVQLVCNGRLELQPLMAVEQSQALCECHKGACRECCGYSGPEPAILALVVLQLWD